MKFRILMLMSLSCGLLSEIIEGVTVLSGHDPGSCSEKNHGNEVLVKTVKGKEKVLICTNEKGVYEWKPLDGLNSFGEYYNPAYDCSKIVDRKGDAKDGFYWINLGGSKPKKVWCDMVTDGGGFILVGKKNSPVSWTLPSNNTPVDPYGEPHWSSSLGDVPILDFRIQVSINEDLGKTKAHWFYRLKSKRPLNNLLNKSSDCSGDAGIDNIAYVKNLETGHIMNTGFRCSKFGHGHSPKSGLGWVKMNKCLEKPCPNGYAFITTQWQHDFAGGFSYSSLQRSSGMNDYATAFVGCNDEKCCACYGPLGGSGNYCAGKCKAINGGTVTKIAFTWFWVRTSLPKGLWKKCMDYEVKRSDGKLISYKITGQSIVPVKGRCSKHSALLHDGVVVVPDNATARKVPPIDGLLAYRKDKQELSVRSNKTWNVLAKKNKILQVIDTKTKMNFDKIVELKKDLSNEKKVVNQKIFQLDSLIKKVNDSLYRDECINSPCVHGECFDGVHSYECKCKTGYEGKHCAKNIDDCVGNGCVHGKCIDGVNLYRCVCNFGYKGKMCNKVIMVPSTCSTANWWSSFDKKGWSSCGKSNNFITGFYRNSPYRSSDPIGLLEEARCCSSIPLLSSQSGECKTANWWGSLDRNNEWSRCPSGYFLNGLYRNSGSYLHLIEGGRCCRPTNHPDRYGLCYNENVGIAFDKKGWTSCSKAGYYITGVYRGTGADWLNNIALFQCCQMAL